MRVHGQDLGKKSFEFPSKFRNSEKSIARFRHDDIVPSNPFVWRFRDGGQLSAQVQHHAFHVLQHKQRLQLRLSNDCSYWLSTPVPMSMAPITGEGIKPFISRYWKEGKTGF